MADLLRRAARQYEVHEYDGGGLRLDLGVRALCGSYEEAVEFALSYVDDRQPAELEVVRIEDGGRERVWSYSAARLAASDHDLVRRWGFDVTRPWQGPPQMDVRY